MKHHLCPPGLESTAILFGLAILFSSCSSSYTVSSAGKPNAEYSYREINEELKGRDIKIRLKDGGVISGKDVKVSEDSVSWVDELTDRESKTNIRQLDGIVTKNHLLGSLEAVGFGLVGGGGLGALVGQVAVGNNGKWGTGAGDAMGFILGGGAGIILGFLTGLIIGHSYNYEFLSTTQSDSLQNGR
jgi:hypothetical protein